MKTIGIYKITSPSNKIYIGQSVDIMARWSFYKKIKCKTQTKLYNSLLKNGVDKHKFEIICQCKREELNELEIYYISLYGSYNSKNGMNLLAGGFNGAHSEETREKMRNRMLGKKYALGFKQTEETKRKVSLASKKMWEKRPRKIKELKISRIGYKHSEETKQKISKGNLGKKMSLMTVERNRIAQTGKIVSQETKDKLRIINLGKKMTPESVKKTAEANKKPVYQIDLVTQDVIKRWRSALSASIALGISNGNISSCCNNKVKQTGGYGWAFAPFGNAMRVANTASPRF